MMGTLFLWIAGFLTLAIFSFLYKDNPFYKIAEHIYVGSAAAYWFLYLWFFDVQPKLLVPYRNIFDKFGFWAMWSHLGAEQWILFIPATLSLFMLLRFIPPVAWLSRWAIAFTVGMAAGLGITGAIQGFIVPQVKATLIPLWSGNIFSSLNNLILIFGTLTTLVYFYFSKEHKGFLKPLSRIGIVFIMIAFGASFGYTIMARVSLLIGRIYFIIYEWLGSIF